MYVVNGDLLKNIKSGVILHGCNAQGVMGGGFAKYLRDMYPEAYDTYHQHYIEHGLNLGDVVPAVIQVNYKNKPPSSLLVINAITQYAFRGHRLAKPGQTQFVDYDAVRECLVKSCALLDGTTQDHTIHMPKIGAGLGGGDWAEITRIIDDVEASQSMVKMCVWAID